jgi:hypothetical protein
MNSIKHQKRRRLGFGVFIVIWSMVPAEPIFRSGLARKNAERQVYAVFAQESRDYSKCGIYKGEGWGRVKYSKISTYN